jgi:polysaccharide biosynthesis/export protein
MRTKLVHAIVLALCLASIAFGEQNNPGSAPRPAEPPSISAVPPEYQVGPEDTLDISVWKEDGLSKNVLVRPDGGISFPLVGEVQAAGKTARQLQQEIELRLTKYIAQPVVSVTVTRIAGNRVYVIGKVNKPGEYVAGRYLNVMQALSLAGGLTPFAAENDIKVLRKVGGKDLVFPFSYSEVRKGYNLEQNITLKGGDVIVVP